VDVNVVSKAVTVVHDPSHTSPGVLVAALNAAALEASLGGRGQGGPREKLYPPITVVLSGLLMIISMVSYGSSPEYLDHFKWVALGSVAVGIPPILRKAWIALRNRTLDINLLMTVAVAGEPGPGGMSC
jgi:Cd2+/Zn2+-exporting ATPase